MTAAPIQTTRRREGPDRFPPERRAELLEAHRTWLESDRSPYPTRVWVDAVLAIAPQPLQRRTGASTAGGGVASSVSPQRQSNVLFGTISATSYWA